MQSASNAPQIYRRDPFVQGSARWATKADLEACGAGEHGQYILGYGSPEKPGGRQYAITVPELMHKITVGTTRSGKGLSSCVPDCLSHTGSALILDPKKGELAKITAMTRRDGLGQRVFLIDPQNFTASRLGFEMSGFNPMAYLDPKSPDFFDDANEIAESVIIPSAKDPHWADEAQNLICGMIMYVCVCPLNQLPNKKTGRTLGQVRDCLNLGKKKFNALVSGEFKKDEDGTIHLIKKGMAQSAHPLVRAAAGRIQNKAENERAGVHSTALNNTHFLESDYYRKILSRNDFHPKMLEDGNTTVYICLSVKKMTKDNRFLRLFTSWALREVSDFERAPSTPVLFLLEEFGTSIGYLKEIERAFGLYAGLGMILSIVLQDFNQLKIYENWETIIGNAGIIQASGVNDKFTQEYLSYLAGTASTEFLTANSAAMRASLLGDPDYFSGEDQLLQRQLILPDELRTMNRAVQLLFIAGCHPKICYKSVYLIDDRFRDKKGQPYFSIDPNFARKPLPTPADLTKPSLDIFRLYEPFFYKKPTVR